MKTILWVILLTAIAGVGGTGLGGAVAAMFQKNSNRTVSLLLSFAGGVMIAVICFDLVAESIAEIPGMVGLVCTALGLAVGYMLIWLLNYVIDRHSNREVAHVDAEHPKTADNLDELIHSDHLLHHLLMDRGGEGAYVRPQLFIAGIVMACAIALHNLPEGMVIGASFAGGAGGAGGAGLEMSARGIALAAVIGLHNIPEGMAVSVPLISGGMAKWKAVLITALSGAPTIIGALIGYWVGALGSFGLCLSLSFASGAMLYVVFGELLPEAILMYKSKLPAFAVFIGILAGLFIING